MKPLEQIFRLAAANPRRIVLAEGEDPRVQAAAAIIVERGICRLDLIGDEARIASGLAGHGVPEGAVTVIDPQTADLDPLAGPYHDLRAAKGMTRDQARIDMECPLRHAAMRVRLGLADGAVAGAVATTADTVRSALQIIGRAPGVQLVSSFFLMLACSPQTAFKGGIIFSDCGLVIEPTAEELAAIARSAAESCRQLLRETPRVAMLSFSTSGSAEHASIDRIREALAIVRREESDLEIDGELQFDAAFESAVRQHKAPESCLTGRPNVLIFPNLAAGNIGYKIAQRLGHLQAIGPILQGLALPMNDLSRGCSVEDVVAAAAVTSVQGQR